jgi:putative NADH-flavin reductase
METVTLFGATGRTGKAIIQEANNYKIKLLPFSKRLPTDDEVRNSIKGSDAVIIVFGPKYNSTDIFCDRYTKQIVNAMTKENVSRLICQTGAMIGEYDENRSFFFKILCNQYKKSSPEGYNDRVEQESTIKKSQLNWTIIKPPRLSDSTTDKKVSSGENLKVGLMSSITRKSLANFILQEVINGENIKKSVFVKN